MNPAPYLYSFSNVGDSIMHYVYLLESGIKNSLNIGEGAG